MSVPAASLRSLSPQAESRYTNTQRAIHSDFNKGMNRDVPSWALAAGYVYDAVDMLFDYPQKMRKRGGTTSPSSSNRAAVVENLIGYQSGAKDGISGIYGTLGKAGTTLISFDKTTGAATSVGTSGSVNTYAMRPFQYLNLIVTSWQATGTTSNDRNITVLYGGSTGAATGDITGTITAGDNRITGLTSASLVASHLGCLFRAYVSGAGVTRVYTGRIIEVTSGTACRVEPTPTIGFTPGTVTIQYGFNWSPNSTDLQVTGRYGCAYQGRMVFGYTCQTGPSTTDYAKGLEYQPNRIVWSTLPTEQPTLTWSPALTSLDGFQFLGGNPILPLNFVDTPGLGGMTGMATVGDGQLMLFGAHTAFCISGQLSSESVANPVFSFSDDQVSQNVGCVSAKSIQYTPLGLVFAYTDNLYVYDGSRMRPLLSGSNARYFQNRLAAGDTIYGSAWAGNRNHYYLSMSGTDGGLMVDFDNFAVSRITNVQLFDATPDPADATKLWGYRWWDTTGAAPTFTKGGLIALDPIWLPTSTNINDADGTAVLGAVQTAAYVDGELSANKLPTDVGVTYKLNGSGAPTVTLSADTKLDVADAAYTTLDSAIPVATTTISKSFQEIGQLLADGPAVEFKLAMNAAATNFEVAALDIGSHHGPPGFST